MKKPAAAKREGGAASACIPVLDADAHALAECIAEFAQTRPLEPTQLLPLLHHVMARTGAISLAAERAIATALNISRADVHGVVTFYDDFAPGAHTHIDICAAEACQARGARALLEHVERTGASDAVRRVYCLGICANGPAARSGERVLAGMTPTRLDQLLAQRLLAQQPSAPRQ